MTMYEEHARLQATAASYRPEVLAYLEAASARFEDAFWGTDRCSLPLPRGVKRSIHGRLTNANLELPVR